MGLRAADDLISLAACADAQLEEMGPGGGFTTKGPAVAEIADALAYVIIHGLALHRLIKWWDRFNEHAPPFPLLPRTSPLGSRRPER